MRPHAILPALAILVLPLALAASVCYAQRNRITFDNQSGRPALVKLIGPLAQSVEVPDGARRTIGASAGKYHLKVRYGKTDQYTYAKGADFVITESATTVSEVTITLHRVVGGNYPSVPITAAEFGEEEGHDTPSPVAPTATGKPALAVHPVSWSSDDRRIRDQLIASLVKKGDKACAEGHVRYAVRAYYFAGQYETDNHRIGAIANRILKNQREARAETETETVTEMIAWATRIRKIIAQVHSTYLNPWEPVVNAKTQLAELQILADDKLVGDLDYASPNVQIGDIAIASLREFLSTPKKHRDTIVQQCGKPSTERHDPDGGGCLTYGRFRIFLNNNGEAIWVCFLPFNKAED